LKAGFVTGIKLLEANETYDPDDQQTTSARASCLCKLASHYVRQNLDWLNAYVGIM
jgi:hypothetical protein